MMLVQSSPEVVIYSGLAEVLSAWDLADARSVSGPVGDWFHLACVAGVSALVAQIGSDLSAAAAGTGSSEVRDTPIAWIANIMALEVEMPRMLASGLAVRLLADGLNVPAINAGFFSLAEERRFRWSFDWARLAEEAYRRDVYRDLIGSPARAAGELSGGFRCLWEPLARRLDEKLAAARAAGTAIGAFPIADGVVAQTIRLPARAVARPQVSTVGPLPAYPYLVRLADLHIGTAVPVSAARAIEEFAAGEVWRHSGDTLELTRGEDEAHVADLIEAAEEPAASPAEPMPSPSDDNHEQDELVDIPSHLPFSAIGRAAGEVAREGEARGVDLIEAAAAPSPSVAAPLAYPSNSDHDRIDVVDDAAQTAVAAVEPVARPGATPEREMTATERFRLSRKIGLSPALEKSHAALGTAGRVRSGRG